MEQGAVGLSIGLIPFSISLDAKCASGLVLQVARCLEKGYLKIGIGFLSFCSPICLKPVSKHYIP
jgi:hypothetical protein